MEGYLRSPESERLLQDRIVTTRNDRYVLLLKAEQKGQLPGIVHGSSGSGASLFVEPLPAVELNNDIVELQDAERREVVRILQELTAQVGDARRRRSLAMAAGAGRARRGAGDGAAGGGDGRAPAGDRRRRRRPSSSSTTLATRC